MAEGVLDQGWGEPPVRIKYDITADALYIFVSEETPVDGVEIDPGTVVDLDASGRIRGIEVIHPARSWPLERIAEEYDLDVPTILALRALWPADAGARYPYANVAGRSGRRVAALN
jgi:uncharacterized protein YuzE